ncbi:MAG: orotate phosphoribosyltransferase [Elusimicrobiota bacterium]
MTEKTIIEELEKSGSFLKGHFLLSSGLHSDTYIQCALALRYPSVAGKFAEELYKQTKNLLPDLIISPALGGIIIGWEVAKIFNKPFIFTEKEDGIVKLRRGFTIEKNMRLLIVEDVFTTGKSTNEVAKIINNYGGTVVGACSIIKRGRPQFDFPHFSLIELELKTYTQDNCPLCKSNIPIVKPGSRKFNMKF